MARIAGVDLQDSWKVDYALTRIRGIGWSLSKKILEAFPKVIAKRVKDLTPDEIAHLTKAVEVYPVEGDLYRIERSNIQRLQTVGAYRGIRHSRSLPSRGQRTRTNARTKRGKRKTVGAFKKELLAKQVVAKEESAKKE